MLKWLRTMNELAQEHNMSVDMMLVASNQNLVDMMTRVTQSWLDMAQKWLDMCSSCVLLPSTPWIPVRYWNYINAVGIQEYGVPHILWEEFVTFSCMAAITPSGVCFLWVGTTTLNTHRLWHRVPQKEFLDLYRWIGRAFAIPMRTCPSRKRITERCHRSI